MAVLFTGPCARPRSPWTFQAFVVFFLASAGASAAYLTSQIFPRAGNCSGIGGNGRSCSATSSPRATAARLRRRYRGGGDGRRRHRRQLIIVKAEQVPLENIASLPMAEEAEEIPDASARDGGATVGPGLEAPMGRLSGGAVAELQHEVEKKAIGRAGAKAARSPGTSSSARSERGAGGRDASAGRSTKPWRPGPIGVLGAAGTKRLSRAPRRYARRVDVNRDASSSLEGDRPGSPSSTWCETWRCNPGCRAHDRPHRGWLPAARLVPAAGAAGSLRQRPRTANHSLPSTVIHAGGGAAGQLPRRRRPSARAVIRAAV